MTVDSFLQAAVSAVPQGAVWSYGIAFAAGIMASAVCPCTLPMGLGMASVVGSYESQKRQSGMAVALAFFFGIVINLTVLGAVAGKLGELLTEAFGQYWAIGMALVSFIAAAFAFFGPRLKTPQLEHFRRPGIVGSFIYGFVFSLGTSAAPLLLLLTVAAAQRSVETGFVLAVFFSIGRGIPFLLIGFFAGLITKFAELSIWRRAIQTFSGVSLLIVGGYYLNVYLSLS